MHQSVKVRGGGKVFPERVFLITKFSLYLIAVWLPANDTSSGLPEHEKFLYTNNNSYENHSHDPDCHIPDGHAC
jgi:hypothetical protein